MSSKPVVAILSPGSMGTGVARLLKGHGYRVVTNITGRSEATRSRAAAAGFELLSSDVDLVNTARVILSIVPPADALSTAQRIAYANTYRNISPIPTIYIDCNATSSATAQKIAHVFRPVMNETPLSLLDGSIMGGPPYIKSSGSNDWYKPRIAISGTWELPHHLEQVLNINRIGPHIGQASALKMCFASLTKGLIGLGTQSFTSAENMGLLPALRDELNAFHPPLGPQMLAFLEKQVTILPTVAFRWIREMEEIADTHAETGFERDVFRGIAEVYRSVSEDSEVGRRREQWRHLQEVLAEIGRGAEEGKKKRAAEAEQQKGGETTDTKMDEDLDPFM